MNAAAAPAIEESACLMHEQALFVVEPPGSDEQLLEPAPEPVKPFCGQASLQKPVDRHSLREEDRDIQAAAGTATGATGNMTKLTGIGKPVEISLRRDIQKMYMRRD